jgi:DNA polymerase-3 subunit gamma/tau
MVRTLSNAFAADRIPQAWMLTGVRGVGKTTTARILARGLNYQLPGQSRADKPTIHMPELGVNCEAIIEGRHIDVMEIDAASHTGVDNIRQINDAVRYAPATARYKVYIIDEVHMLSTGAFNAFLKTLEEPPPHAKFVFATTEIRKVPVTILSRCQRFDLRRVEADKLVAHLEKICGLEGVEAEPEALAAIARAAEGVGARFAVAARPGDRPWGRGRDRRHRTNDARTGRPGTGDRPVRGGDARRRGRAASRSCGRSTTPGPTRR